MNRIKKYTTKNRCYTNGIKIIPKGLMLHSVGCAQPKAKVFINSFDSRESGKAVHGFIDAETGDFYQTLPYNCRAWHCGKGNKGTGNSTHIGIEMCESSGIKYVGNSITIVDKKLAQKQCELAYKTAIELFAKLCKDYSLNPLKDIISHHEGHLKGVASNHGDPEHYWKAIGLGYTMDGFRADVKATIDGTKKKASEEVHTEPTDDSNSFKVKIIADVLNVRQKASSTSKIVTAVKEGEVYTIVDTDGNWGKLKSGKGWIYLKNYTKKI